jgi:arabinan endo-1,5-alpha-L-arabinosidase
MVPGRTRFGLGGWAFCAALGVLVVALGACAQEEERLRGDLGIHDPSTIVKAGSRYWVFGTGRGILTRSSADLREWRAGPPVFSQPPAWTTNAVPASRGRFWAPDVLHHDGRYWLYYSVSTWGSRNSAIGLATRPTLDPDTPGSPWEDRGLVIRSSERDDYNAIDPSVMRDAQGRLWLAFGSFWSGIKLVELNPKTGLRRDPDAPVHPLAWKEAIEAPCLYQHGDYYYLLVNWGLCCRGTNSTYNIRVGRSTKVTGPYLDREGMDLRHGGGSLLRQTRGSHIGPGHAGVLEKEGAYWLSYHFYDGRNQGTPTLDVRPLRWSADGWPELDLPVPD